MDVFQVSGAGRSGGAKALSASANFLGDFMTFGATELFQAHAENQVRDICDSYTVNYSRDGSVSR